MLKFLGFTKTCCEYSNKIVKYDYFKYQHPISFFFFGGSTIQNLQYQPKGLHYSLQQL